MSKPTQRTRASKLMALMQVIDAERAELNRARRYIAELERQALRLVRGVK